MTPAVKSAASSAASAPASSKKFSDWEAAERRLARAERRRWRELWGWQAPRRTQQPAPQARRLSDPGLRISKCDVYVTKSEEQRREAAVALSHALGGEGRSWALSEEALSSPGSWNSCGSVQAPSPPSVLSSPPRSLSTPRAFDAGSLGLDSRGTSAASGAANTRGDADAPTHAHSTSSHARPRQARVASTWRGRGGHVIEEDVDGEIRRIYSLPQPAASRPARPSAPPPSALSPVDPVLDNAPAAATAAEPAPDDSTAPRDSSPPPQLLSSRPTDESLPSPRPLRVAPPHFPPRPSPPSASSATDVPPQQALADPPPVSSEGATEEPPSPVLSERHPPSRLAHESCEPANPPPAACTACSPPVWPPPPAAPSPPLMAPSSAEPTLHEIAVAARHAARHAAAAAPSLAYPPASAPSAGLSRSAGGRQPLSQPRSTAPTARGSAPHRPALEPRKIPREAAPARKKVVSKTPSATKTSPDNKPLLKPATPGLITPARTVQLRAGREVPVVSVDLFERRSSAPAEPSPPTASTPSSAPPSAAPRRSTDAGGKAGGDRSSKIRPDAAQAPPDDVAPDDVAPVVSPLIWEERSESLIQLPLPPPRRAARPLGEVREEGEGELAMEMADARAGEAR